MSVFAEKLGFRRVYFDGEPLSKKPRQWPLVTVELEGTFALLDVFDVPAVLLEPV